MVIGIGTDLIEIGRVMKAYENASFRNRIYTKNEQDLIMDHPKRCASNFAVKEAISKMLGTGFGKIKPIEIEVLREESGRPYVILYGQAEERRKELNIDDILVSISDTKEYAIAYVIGQSNHIQNDTVTS